MLETHITYRIIESPIGPLLLAASPVGLRLIQFDADKLPESDQEDTPSHLANAILDKTELQLKQYFAKLRTEFDIPLDFQGTEFQSKVWEALLEVPYGKTRTYMEQTMVLGDPKAIRAVANANGKNKIPIVIPCHRIIGADGSLTGFAGGLSKKRFLLELESKQMSLF
jgi:methylated-DNA-[protein]-cysteine S-methyltransferase